MAGGKLRARMVAVLMMSVVPLITFAAVIAMNNFTAGLEEEKGPGVVMMNVEKKKQKRQEPPKTNLQQAKQKSSRRSDRLLAPPPMLGRGLAGIKLDIEEFAIDEVLGMSEGLKRISEDLVMTEESVDSMPEPIQQSGPRYPPRSRARNVEGYVKVSFVVGIDGRVKNAKVVESKPLGEFDQAALVAVKSWQFRPATYQGREVEMAASQKFTFALR